MTLGHFTSWRADDRGYYTGVGYTPAELDHSFGAPMCPAWCKCDIQYMIQRDRKRDREQSERERGVGHIFGATSWADVGIHRYMCYI